VDRNKTAKEKEEDYNNLLREEYVKRILADGFEILEPEGNELLIDLDTPEQIRMFHSQYEMLERNMCDECYPLAKFIWPSRGGNGEHVYIAMDFNMTPGERIAFQAALGSDPKRELLSLIRFKKGDIKPTILVEVPGMWPQENIKIARRMSIKYTDGQ